MNAYTQSVGKFYYAYIIRKSKDWVLCSRISSGYEPVERVTDYMKVRILPRVQVKFKKINKTMETDPNLKLL